MSKYTPTFAPRSRSIQSIREAHPIWRGIGCLLLVLVPVLSFAGAKVLVQANFRQHWIETPGELVRSFIMPVVGKVYFADLAVTIILIVICFGILTVVYALIYRLFGPPRVGPLDSPPG